VYRDIVRRAITEDEGSGDLTTRAMALADRLARGTFLAKSPCVLAGMDVAVEAVRQLDPSVDVERHHADGDACDPGEHLATVTGRASSLLTAERTALNFLQRMSGIATVTREFVAAAAGRIVVLDTRKTTPTLRAIEKYAVRAGGGVNHRAGLDSGLLIKDNHIRLVGGVGEALRRMRAAGHGMPIEVEAQSLDELDEALAANASFIMLDNLSLEDIREAVRRCRGRAKLEISGGVTLIRLPELASTGADYVSVGALTHSVRAADISLELEPVQ
jgi:nicotinate-nucleotide pyrophosphorylase (carboxylating)